MAYFEGIGMTGGYGNGPDIINSCSVDVNRGEINSHESYAWVIKIKIWFCGN
jgi:hypothetical protein